MFDFERRTRADLRDKATDAMTRVHQVGLNEDHRALLTLAELKVLGAAEEILREIIRRLL